MNEEKTNNSISENNSEQDIRQVPATAEQLGDVQVPVQTTYDNFIWILNYTKMFATRLSRDLFQTVRRYIYSEQHVPDHIGDLMQVQSEFRKQQELNSGSYSSSREHHHLSSLPNSIRNFVQAFQSYVFTSEDEIALCSLSGHRTEINGIAKDPMFVLVDSNEPSNPSSAELLLDDADKDSVLRKFFNTHIKPAVRTSTSKDHKESESKEEIQMVDINLQSENELVLEDNEVENESVVLAYLRNKKVLYEFSSPLLSNKNKYSSLCSVPRMETILEGDQFSNLPSVSEDSLLTILSCDGNFCELSETSLDALIPSYPGSPRSINAVSEGSIPSIERRTHLREAVDFIHRDNEFLVAAEIGNDRLLEKLMREYTDIQQRDLLGRNALHLAVCSNNFRAIEMLVKAGVDTNVKDNLGMTPLSLCLMRRPSMRVANLLFDYGATIMERTDPIDTGLFIQFVMMCVPTPEEEAILRLLVEKGAKVNDAEAPGGRQALHFAAMSNNCPLIRILVDLGADMYLTNHRDETPREVARTFKCKKALILLDQLEMESESTTTYGTLSTVFEAID